jgi:hypothetical protein
MAVMPMLSGYAADAEEVLVESAGKPHIHAGQKNSPAMKPLRPSTLSNQEK